MYPLGVFVRLAIVLCALGSVTLAPGAQATEVAETQEPTRKSFFRGSSVSYRHTATTRTFDKSFENTWNPYYAQTVVLSPRVWLSDGFNLSANALFTREFTQSDVTTEENETLMGDLTVSANAPRIVHIEAASLSLGAGLAVITPTSKSSQARTMMTAISPRATLTWSAKVLSGLNISLSSGITRYFHEFTTSGRESPLVGSCAGTTTGCGAFLNTGLRNTEWRLRHGATLSLGITEQLSVAVSQSLSTDWLHALESGLLPSLTPQETQDQRYGAAFDISVGVKAVRGLDLRLGMSTAGPQLAPDSSYYNPFYNRYSAIYLDLVCDLDEVVGLVAEGLATEP